MNLQQAWNDYLLTAVPKEASKAQVRETKKAFYAGATAMMVLASEAANTSDEEAVFTAMSALADECSSVMKGFMVADS